MKKFLMMFFVALAVGFQSCDNNDDLWDAIDDLKGRVQALETQVNALNGNVEALQQLYSGATISKVEELADKFVLTLTNGERIELAKGSQATAVIPVIGIDENGQWRYSVQEGVWISLGVKAEAEDGRTPQFRIDENTGYWQVRYGDAEEYVNVTDTSGQPVKAIGEGSVTDKFFEDARLDGDEFYLKLLDGTELRVPVVKDFFIRIVTATEGVQTFDAGATKRFVVESKGVVNTVVTAPEGWTAFLTDAGTELVVTAPDAAPASRASADTSKDVAVQATSAGGFSAIAKIQVASSGVAPVAPTLTVVNSATVEPTASSLTFDIQTDGDSWYYLIQKTAEATTPDAATIAATGIAGAGSSVTVENLEANTAYTFHAVAVKQNEPVLYSEVRSAENTTAAEITDPNDYYTYGVEINGVRYDQNTEGAKIFEVKPDAAEDAILAVGSGGIVFVDDKSETYDAMAPASGQGISKDLVIIGRYADSKPVFKIPKYWALRNVGGIVAFKNLKVDASVLTDNYLFNATNATGGLETLVFEDCEITFEKIFLTMASAAESTGIGNIIFRNCKLRFTGGGTNYSFITLKTIESGLDKFKSLVFENNIIYSTKGDAGPAITLFLQDNATTAMGGSLSNLAITCTNNTFVDFISYGGSLVGSAYFYVGKIGSVNFSKNILCASATKWISVMRVLYDYNTNAPWPQINLDRTENKVYGATGWKLYFDTAGTGSYKPDGVANSYTKLNDDPLSVNDPANGRFVVASEYAGYGSTLE